MGVVETVIWEIPLIRIQLVSTLHTLTSSQSPGPNWINMKTVDLMSWKAMDEMWTKFSSPMCVALTLIWEIPHFLGKNTQIARFG